jgi:hypothetical protein
MATRCGLGRDGLGVLLVVALATVGGPVAAAGELGASIFPAVEAALHDAPSIVLHTPRDGGTYASPLGIDIGFEPAHGAAIDLSTLKVTVVTHTLIGDLTFDITDDVSPYVSSGGIRARRARIPAGEHTVTIRVADTLQRQAERQLTFTVRGKRARAD